MKTSFQHDIEAHLLRACSPSADRAAVREREQAMHALVAMGDPAYRLIINALQENTSRWDQSKLISLASAFQREESAAVFARHLLHGSDEAKRAAAIALVLTGNTAAENYLTLAVSGNDERTRIAVADAFHVCGRRSGCALLQTLLADTRANVRYYAVNAAASLGCLTQTQLQCIRDHDQDEHLRALAQRYLQE